MPLSKLLRKRSFLTSPDGSFLSFLPGWGCLVFTFIIYFFCLTDWVYVCKVFSMIWLVLLSSFQNFWLLSLQYVRSKGSLAERRHSYIVFLFVGSVRLEDSLVIQAVTKLDWGGHSLAIRVQLPSSTFRFNIACALL